MRKKNVAGFFALFFGMLGLHRFYLGQRRRGIFYFVATVFMFIASIENNAPIVMIMGAIAFIDAMIFFSMPAEEFDGKYNRNAIAQRMRSETDDDRPQVRRQPMARRSRPVQVSSSAKASGVKKYRDYDYEGAIEDFKKALGEKYDDPATHFNIACCYSLVERPDPAFFHLTKAVHFGFVDFDKIEKHEALAYLRTLPEFEDFVRSGYQRMAALPAAQEDLLPKTPHHEAEETLLDQIKRLGELRNQGILTEEEFVTQTKRVLGN